MKRNGPGAALGVIAALAFITSGHAMPFNVIGSVPDVAPKVVILAQQRGPADYRGGAADYRGPAPGAGRTGVEVRKGAAAVGSGSRVRRIPLVPARGWVRPPSYWWNPGAAVAAGVALGYATAIAAEALSESTQPASNYCWFYTNPERTKGFWDVCPP